MCGEQGQALMKQEIQAMNAGTVIHRAARPIGAFVLLGAVMLALAGCDRHRGSVHYYNDGGYYDDVRVYRSTPVVVRSYPRRMPPPVIVHSRPHYAPPPVVVRRSPRHAPPPVFRDAPRHSPGRGRPHRSHR